MFSFTPFRFTLLPVLFCCSSTFRKNLNWIKFDYLEKKSRRWIKKVDVCFSKISNEDTWIIIRRIWKFTFNLQFFKLPSQKLKWKPLFSPVEKISVTFEGRLGYIGWLKAEGINLHFSWIFLKLINVSARSPEYNNNYYYYNNGGGLFTAFPKEMALHLLIKYIIVYVTDFWKTN